MSIRKKLAELDSKLSILEVDLSEVDEILDVSLPTEFIDAADIELVSPDEEFEHYVDTLFEIIEVAENAMNSDASSDLDEVLNYIHHIATYVLKDGKPPWS